MVSMLWLRALIILTTTRFSIPQRRLSDGNFRNISWASASVWSSSSGWGLQLNGCNNRQQPLDCSASLARYSLALTPEDVPPHQPRQGEGLAFTILNQRNANVIFHKVFPLGKYWAHYADLQWHMDRVTPGRIVIMAVAVSGTVGLRESTQQLTQLGSLFALHLTPMAHWTWVLIKGGRTISETVILQGPAQQQVHFNLPISDLPMPASSSTQTQQQRWHYCHTNAVMAGLCDEHTPDPLPPPSPPTVSNQQALAHVPVIVTAGARHHYLYHTLTALLIAPGAQPNNVLVVLGDAPHKTTQLLNLLNVNYTKVPVHGKDNLKLFRYYRSVFELVAKTFPDAPAAIFLDEDVEVSPDFFSFMSQTLWLLKKDPTLYCINGFSMTGIEGRPYNPTRLLRGAVQVEWGYALTLDFIKESLVLWEKHNNSVDLYDFWLYRNVRKTRECVFPEVTRTRHFGIGVNTHSYIHEELIKKPFQKKAHVALQGLNTLPLPSWQQHIVQDIKSAKVLTGNPCHEHFIPALPSARTFAFFYRLDSLPEEGGRPDDFQYHNAVQCFGIWSYSEQGHHRGVTTVHISHNATLYLIGVPYSHYSYLYSPPIKLWDAALLTDEQMDQMKNYANKKYNKEAHLTNTNMTTEYLMDILSNG